MHGTGAESSGNALQSRKGATRATQMSEADARFHFTVSAVSQPLWLCKVPQERVPPLPIYMLTLHSHPISVADVG